VPTDKAFTQALDGIVATRQGAARSFPDAAKNEVAPFVDGLRVPAFDAGDAIKMTQVLRDQAGAAYGAGNKELGKAYREASKAIEDQLERHLAKQGKEGAEALKNFRDARQLMAKSHSVESAIVEGGGKVNARVLGAALQRGKPLTDELKTIGAFANNFKDVARVPESGWANPITTLDAFGTAGMAAMDAGIGSIGLPAARLASRYGILSQPYQKAFTGPQSYGPGLMTRTAPGVLEKLERLGLGGLLGPSIYAAQ
jgi:hypothetical protein